VLMREDCCGTECDVMVPSLNPVVGRFGTNDDNLGKGTITPLFIFTVGYHNVPRLGSRTDCTDPPGLFTDTSEHIRFYSLVFLFSTVILSWFYISHVCFLIACKIISLFHIV